MVAGIERRAGLAGSRAEVVSTRSARGPHDERGRRSDGRQQLRIRRMPRSRRRYSSPVADPSPLSATSSKQGRRDTACSRGHSRRGSEDEHRHVRTLNTSAYGRRDRTHPLRIRTICAGWRGSPPAARSETSCGCPTEKNTSPLRGFRPPARICSDPGQPLVDEMLVGRPAPRSLGLSATRVPVARGTNHERHERRLAAIGAGGLRKVERPS